METTTTVGTMAIDWADRPSRGTAAELLLGKEARVARRRPANGVVSEGEACGRLVMRSSVVRRRWLCIAGTACEAMKKRSSFVLVCYIKKIMA